MLRSEPYLRRSALLYIHDAYSETSALTQSGLNKHFFIGGIAPHSTKELIRRKKRQPLPLQRSRRQHGGIQDRGMEEPQTRAATSKTGSCQYAPRFRAVARASRGRNLQTAVLRPAPSALLEAITTSQHGLRNQLLGAVATACGTQTTDRRGHGRNRDVIIFSWKHS